MASIAGTGYTTRARWTLTALLRRLQPPVRPRNLSAPAEKAASSEAALARTSIRSGRARRYYPPQRDAVFEHSAMAREMFRL